MIPVLWKIYCDSFPMEERRRQRAQIAIERNPQYQIEPLMKGDEAIGMICYWDFKAFCFIEHFAIAEAYRGSGRGKAFLADFMKGRKKPIVLEVEPPGADEAQDSERHKRIRFYEAVGFYLTDFAYLQPPYEKDHVPIPLVWMTYGMPTTEQSAEHQLSSHSATFAHWKKIVFSAVYGKKEA